MPEVVPKLLPLPCHRGIGQQLYADLSVSSRSPQSTLEQHIQRRQLSQRVRPTPLMLLDWPVLMPHRFAAMSVRSILMQTPPSLAVWTVPAEAASAPSSP